MPRLKWHYIVSIIFFILPMLFTVACDGMVPSESGLPVINEFYADPQEALPAESAILHWNVSGASTVTIEPNVGEVALSGERGVNPIENTTYILTASNDVGSVTASTEVIGSKLIATVVEGSPPVDVPELPESSELPEPPEETAILVLDPENRPMWRVVEEPASLEPTEPPVVEPLEALAPTDTPYVLPIIRRLEAVYSVNWFWGRYVRVYFDVLNSDEMDINFGIRGIWRTNWLHRRSSGYTNLVYNDPDEGLFFALRPSGTREIIFRAQSEYGTSTRRLTIYIDEPTATVKPIPSVERVPPTIHYFNANPATIAVGSFSTLSWEVSNADTISITGMPLNIVASSSGSVSVSPPSTTKFKLTATNSGGSQSQSVAVYVEESIPSEKALLPIIHYFNANPVNIPPGGSSKLSWDVSNADAVTVTAVSLKEAVSSSGSMSVSPPSTTTYQLTATNSGGSQSQSLTVTVEGSEVPTPTPLEEKAKPDLVITDIWRTGSTQWNYRVKNQGKVECSESSYELRIDGKGQASQSISPLAPGESREFYFSHKFACESGTSHTWAVVADVKGAIEESDEGNNSRMEKFTCSK